MMMTTVVMREAALGDLTMMACRGGGVARGRRRWRWWRGCGKGDVDGVGESLCAG